MSRSVNRVILLGRVGRDAETSFTSNQTAVTKFSVATTHRWKDSSSGEWKDETTWTNCIVWRQEKLGEILTKGKQVFVEGRLQNRSYEKDGEKKYVSEVVAEEVVICSGRSD